MKAVKFLQRFNVFMSQILKYLIDALSFEAVLIFLKLEQFWLMAGVNISFWGGVFCFTGMRDFTAESTSYFVFKMKKIRKINEYLH